MDAFYFGSKDRMLLGYYHPPSSSMVRENTIVICNPIGHEYVRTYNAMKRLAQQLAARGNHVMRFDYSGTGDSTGSSDNVSMSHWTSDIESAASEIREISGCSRLNLVGLRFGALMAYAASDSCGARGLVMMDPVLDAGAYLDRLTDLHEKMLHDESRFIFTAQSVKTTEEELLGHPFPGELQREMRSVSVQNLGVRRLTSLDLYCTQPPEKAELDILRRGGDPEVGVHVAAEPVDWDRIDSIEDQITLRQTIDAVSNLKFRA